MVIGINFPCSAVTTVPPELGYKSEPIFSPLQAAISVFHFEIVYRIPIKRSFQCKQPVPVVDIYRGIPSIQSLDPGDRCGRVVSPGYGMGALCGRRESDKIGRASGRGGWEME